MGLMPKFLLASIFLLSTLGCTSVDKPYRSRGLRPKTSVAVASQDSTAIADQIEAAILASGRVEVFSAINGYDDPIGHGSGWCFKRENGKSYWMTCRHVVDDPSKVFRIRYWKKSTDTIEILLVNEVLFDKTGPDLAIVICKGEPEGELHVSDAGIDARIIKDTASGKTTLALSAWSADMAVPSVVTFGVVRAFVGGRLLHSTGGYYGASGSALIDSRSMTVIGVRNSIGRPSLPNGMPGEPRSDRMAAVPASEIRKFVEVTLERERKPEVSPKK